MTDLVVTDRDTEWRRLKRPVLDSVSSHLLEEGHRSVCDLWNPDAVQNGNNVPLASAGVQNLIR
jgi:hypothetical protein